LRRLGRDAETQKALQQIRLRSKAWRIENHAAFDRMKRATPAPENQDAVREKTITM
jgi:hypothetical protein